jgi:hypothetical protein
MKKIIIGILVAILTISMTCTFTQTNVGASPTMKIYIDPPQIINEALTINSTFQIAVKTADAIGLVGLQFKIYWDPSILAGVNMSEKLYSTVTPAGEEDNVWRLKHVVTTDHIEYAYTYLDVERAIDGGYAPISGNYTVATINMKVKGIGKTTLDLRDTIPGDADGDPIPHDAYDGYFQNSPPPPPAQIYLEPSKISNLSLTPSHNFTVNVNIANATDVYALEFKLGFDPTILHANSAVAGDFIPPSVTPTVERNNTAGYIMFNATLGTPVSGNGTLAIIEFHVEALGRTDLDLYDTKLFDAIGQPLAHSATDGSFSNSLLAKLAVDPPELIDPTLLPPATFTINVTITDVEDLYGYEFNLTFDPSILVCLQVSICDVLNETNYIPNQYIDGIHGYVKINVTYFPPAVPLNIYSPTPLVTIKFRVRAVGASNLTLTNTNLVDSSGNPIAHETQNGFFQSLIRDVAVLDIFPAPTEVYQGQCLNITVVVRNEGNITETFTVNIYINATLLTTINITGLPPNENATETFAWNTAGHPYGRYTLRAEAPPLLFETDTADNTLTDGMAKVKIPGDINSDDAVNILDALLAGNAFGSFPEHPYWNPDCDLNNDNVINILDLIILGGHFGIRI